MRRMSIYMCERCHSKVATETSAVGRFCQDCDAINDLELQESALQEENIQLRAIVQALAESDPYAYNDNSGRMECLFCNDTWGWSPYDKQTKDHDPDCLIMQARALIRKP